MTGVYRLWNYFIHYCLLLFFFSFFISLHPSHSPNTHIHRQNGNFDNCGWYNTKIRRLIFTVFPINRSIANNPLAVNAQKRASSYTPKPIHLQNIIYHGGMWWWWGVVLVVVVVAGIILHRVRCILCVYIE